jgi:hypothetical protein
MRVPPSRSTSKRVTRIRRALVSRVYLSLPFLAASIRVVRLQHTDIIPKASKRSGPDSPDPGRRTTHSR